MQAEKKLQKAGEFLIRYGVVLVVGWIGAMKFTTGEAYAIQPLVEHSPLLSWVYRLMSVVAFSKLLGTVELTVALLVALRPFSPKASAVGSS